MEARASQRAMTARRYLALCLLLTSACSSGSGGGGGGGGGFGGFAGSGAGAGGVVVGEVFVPDAHLVGQDPQRHQRVGCALVFDEDVEVGVVVIEGGAEQQVGVPVSQILVDEGAWLQFESVEVEVCQHLRRQDRT